jgi:diacylglycerol kinase family enzyme
MNVGVLDYENKHRRFAVSTGIGFDAAVCHQVMVTPLKAFLNRLKLGKLTYLGVALHKLLTLKPVTMTVTTETGETKTYHKVYFTAVINMKAADSTSVLPPAGPMTDWISSLSQN